MKQNALLQSNIKKDQSLELSDACRLVENYARSLGKDCQIIFTDTMVSVAPLSWSGDATGKTLYEALTEARLHE